MPLAFQLIMWFNGSLFQMWNTNVQLINLLQSNCHTDNLGLPGGSGALRQMSAFQDP